MSKRLLFIGATHGDEGFAVEVLRDIESEFDKGQYNYDWIIGNPRALAEGKRYTQTDLNRSAPGDPESPNYEERRAAEIVALSQEYDAVVDLHGSVANCGIVKIIPYPTLANIALARSIPVQRNVVWYAPESAISGPLVQHTACPAVEIECGPKDDSKIARGLRKVVAAILVANQRLGQEEGLSVPKQEFYSVYGLERGSNPTLQDFQRTTQGGETFYPFMSNQYPGIACYKMKSVSPETIVIPG